MPTPFPSTPGLSPLPATCCTQLPPRPTPPHTEGTPPPPYGGAANPVPTAYAPQLCCGYKSTCAYASIHRRYACLCARPAAALRARRTTHVCAARAQPRPHPARTRLWKCPHTAHPALLLTHPRTRTHTPPQALPAHAPPAHAAPPARHRDAHTTRTHTRSPPRPGSPAPPHGRSAPRPFPCPPTHAPLRTSPHPTRCFAPDATHRHTSHAHREHRRSPHPHLPRRRSPPWAHSGRAEPLRHRVSPRGRGPCGRLTMAEARRRGRLSWRRGVPRTAPGARAARAHRRRCLRRSRGGAAAEPTWPAPPLRGGASRRTASTPPLPSLAAPPSRLRWRPQGTARWRPWVGLSFRSGSSAGLGLRLQCFSVPSRAKGATGGVPSVGCSSSLRLGSAALLSGSQAL